MKIYHYILFVLISVVIASCSSKEDKAKALLEENVQKTWAILEEAKLQSEIEMSVPLGFTLGCTEAEFQKQLNKVIKKNGVRDEEGVKYIKVNEFGKQVTEARISNFHYFSDPNTETDTISEVCFVFDEFRTSSTEEIKSFLDFISSKFDSSWKTSEFQIDYQSENLSDYRKYWVKNNLAVEFSYPIGSFVTLSFYNIPKYGVEFFQKEVASDMNIHETVKKEREELDDKPKIMNSSWDCSVYQVKRYLEKSLKDPDSYVGIEWGKVQQNGIEYKVYHKYRAKNSFGGYVIESHIFTLDADGNVTNVE